MIVVIGSPIGKRTEDDLATAGLSAGIAGAAAAAGGAVQLIGRVGHDDDGDLLTLALAANHVGHVALLRDAGHPTPVVEATAETDVPIEVDGGAIDEPPDQSAGAPLEPPGLPVDAGDVELGLRYLVDFRVIVVATRLDERAMQVVTDAAAYAGARLVVLRRSSEPPATMATDAIVLEAPTTDDDGVFATLVGGFAAALDRGDDPQSAFRTATTAGGWERVPG